MNFDHMSCNSLHRGPFFGIVVEFNPEAHHLTATMMKLFEREAALVGADAPKKVEQTNSYKATDDELAASLQMVSPILESLIPRLNAFRSRDAALTPAA
jgi:hypothetical protein